MRTQERYDGFMNTAKVLSDIEVLKLQVIELQAQLEEMRKSVLVLLESSEIGDQQKTALCGSMAAKAEVVEVQTARIEHEKTIQQLLDESQRPH